MATSVNNSVVEMAVVNFQDMSVDNLRKVASKLSIPNYTRFKKDELIKMIETQRTRIDQKLEERVENYWTAAAEKGDVELYEKIETFINERELKDMSNEELIEVLSFKSKTVAAKPARKMKEKKVVETTESEEVKRTYNRVKRDLPKEGSKSEEILEHLRMGKSIYQTAKDLGTYYSVVQRVYKVYLKPEDIKEVKEIEKTIED